MNIISVRSFAETVLESTGVIFVQHGDAFDDRSMSQAQVAMQRVQQCVIDQSLYQDMVLLIGRKFMSILVRFDDDTIEARGEIEVLVTSSMKCGYVVAQAEVEFGWANGPTSISKSSETLLSATADSLVREMLRKNHHPIEGQMRVVALYCGYLLGRFGASSVLDLMNGLDGLAISVGPR